MPSREGQTWFTFGRRVRSSGVGHPCRPRGRPKHPFRWKQNNDANWKRLNGLTLFLTQSIRGRCRLVPHLRLLRRRGSEIKSIRSDAGLRQPLAGWRVGLPCAAVRAPKSGPASVEKKDCVRGKDVIGSLVSSLITYHRNVRRVPGEFFGAQDSEGEAALDEVGGAQTIATVWTGGVARARGRRQQGHKGLPFKGLVVCTISAPAHVQCRICRA